MWMNNPLPAFMTRKKLLIVDDCRVVLTTFRARLEAEGYEIRTAEDPSDALTIAPEFDPDVLIMDVNFPAAVGTVSWDGIKLLAWLQSTGVTPRSSAVIITSDLPHKHESRARMVGATAVLQKPVKVKELLSAIERCCAKAEQAA